ncbi:YdeI family protein [Demequina sp. NBRC 110053]|uniref:YdeI/OmpD-associated family protein n=1 Tax=Demequina sp. NBRC 110053 TaxID=1570342 RepID=UPI001F36983F|nr:YdeI/OmpD-associated family protein [Demequina sp. NBRC 110053]
MHPIDAAPDGRERIHPESAAEWRAWLAEHHRRTQGTWVVRWLAASGRESLTYEQLVRELLCFGWIDSTAGAIDADRSMLWCAPRKKGSMWSRVNKNRVAELESAGLIEAQGIAVIERAKADGSWTLLDDVEDLTVPEDLAAALAARPGAREHFDAFPPSARKYALTQLVLAKRPQTRAKRVTAIADAAAKGERL